MRKKTLSFALLFAAAAVSSALCQGNDKANDKALTPSITINPTVAKLDGLHTVKRKADGGGKFFLGEFASAVSGETPVGRTRTGRKTASEILCAPDPAGALKAALSGALSAQGLLAESADGAEFVISVDVPEFKLEEVTKRLHQSITATMRAEVAITRAGGERVKRFKMESVGDRKAFDTTKQAEVAAREAVRAAADEILKSLDSL